MQGIPDLENPTSCRRSSCKSCWQDLGFEDQEMLHGGGNEGKSLAKGFGRKVSKSEEKLIFILLGIVLN
ncbi:unnamed protein product [Camellia sinensis]